MSTQSIIFCCVKRRDIFPMEKIDSTLGSERVLQPSSEELTFEPIPCSVALAYKRGISWGSEKGLLPTAAIYVNGHQGRLKLGCVLDSASESSFLTLHAAERLGLDKIKTDFTVQGLNSTSAKINYLARESVSNSDQTFNLNVNMFLTTEIIKVHPSKKINISDLVIPKGIVLADEGFNQPSEISCLIGSEHFFDIFETKQIRVPNSNFRLIDSKFGYVVTRVARCVREKNRTTFQFFYYLINIAENDKEAFNLLLCIFGI
ncbi:uncharacterized protein TNCV_2242671 [Trichonephila clavipes]|nr:uncharacterized protein TNCV_2242671 [Trichonephila clavipes]